MLTSKSSMNKRKPQEMCLQAQFRQTLIVLLYLNFSYMCVSYFLTFTFIILLCSPFFWILRKQTAFLALMFCLPWINPYDTILSVGCKTCQYGIFFFFELSLEFDISTQKYMVITQFPKKRVFILEIIYLKV